MTNRPIALPTRGALLLLALALPFISQAQRATSPPADTATALPALIQPEVLIEAARGVYGAQSATTTVLSGKTLAVRNQGQDIPYLLQATPSAVVSSDAGTGVGYTYLRIRGTDPTRTNVTLNGVPVNDAESQATFWVNLPDLTASLDQIQIQRGVGSSTVGPGAFGASVTMRLAQPSEAPTARASLHGGSFGTLRRSIGAGTGRLPGGFAFEGRVSGIDSRGYVDRASSWLRSGYLTGSWQSGSHRVSGIYLSGDERTYQAWYGATRDELAVYHRFNSAGTDFGQRLPPHPDEVDRYGQRYYQLTWQGSAPLADPAKGDWLWELTPFLTTGRGYYEQYKVGQTSLEYALPADALAPGVEGSDLVRRRWLDNRFYGATGLITRPLPIGALTVGGLVSEYRGHGFGHILWAERLTLPGPEQEYYRSPSRKREGTGFVKLIFFGPGSGTVTLAPTTPPALSTDPDSPDPAESPAPRPLPPPVPVGGPAAALPPSARTGLTFFLDGQVRLIDHQISGTEAGNAFTGPRQVSADRRFVFFNPKAGGRYQRAGSPHAFEGSVAVAHREPTRTALLALPPLALPGGGTGGTPLPGDQGPTAPRAERLIDYELSWLAQGLGPASPSAGVTLYYMDYDQQLVTTGLLDDVGNTVLRNVARSYRRGVEVMGRLPILPARAGRGPTGLPRLEVQGSVTLSQNHILDHRERAVILDEETFAPLADTVLELGRVPLALSPGLLATGMLMVRPATGLEAELIGRYVGRQQLDHSGSAGRRLAAYSLADLRVTWQPSGGPLGRALEGHVRLTGQILNALDRRYEASGYAFALFGRSPAGGRATATEFAYLSAQAGRQFLVGIDLIW